MANLHRCIHHVCLFTQFHISIYLQFPAQMPGSSSWASAHAKAVALVGKMTLAEKANITVGLTPSNGCSGVTRLNWPGLCLSDAGNGLRATDFVNGWPSGIHVGASWNRDLSYKRGYQMGGEFKTKGVHVALGPVVGPLGRIAKGGRNWEGISNDREYFALFQGVSV